MRVVVWDYTCIKLLSISWQCEKFSEWYSKTLQSYKTIFGMNPPVNIWPEPSVRFREGQMWQWIDTSQYVLVHQSIGFVMILIGLLFFLGLAWLGIS